MPQLVATYNDKMKNNPKVELILMSADRGDAAALSWSKKENFPWPQIMKSNVSREFNFMKHRSRYVPQYLLVDKDGNKVADGLGPSLSKLGISK